MHRGFGCAAVLGLFALLAGCTAGPSAPTPAPGFGPLGAPGCSPASPISEQSGFVEVQGTPNAGSEGVSLFGWIMADGVPPLHAGRDVKVVWRMVGVGGESVRLFDPTGRETPLTWGPEPHASSNYERPGLEWGTGFVLDEPGCWELRFGSGNSGASVWFEAPL